MAREDPSAVLRIGELSRRLGVSDHVLRAWERRYGLLQPVRTDGGFRLYSDADERRVRRMQAYLTQGLSAAEAARAALTEEATAGTPPDGPTRDGPTPDGPGGMAEAARALARALDEMDEPAAQTVLDRLLTTFTVETVLRDVVLPYLYAVGERWARGEVSVGQEHFASNVLRGRMAGLARGWGHGHGPRAVLACPPGELHDLPLLAFGIVLYRSGWRVSYLGANTPIDDLVRAAADTSTALVVLAATTPERFDGLTKGLSRLAKVARLALAGRGATPALARAVGAQLLADDPVTAAEALPAPPG